MGACCAHSCAPCVRSRHAKHTFGPKIDRKSASSVDNRRLRLETDTPRAAVLATNLAAPAPARANLPGGPGNLGAPGRRASLDIPRRKLGASRRPRHPAALAPAPHPWRVGRCTHQAGFYPQMPQISSLFCMHSANGAPRPRLVPAMGRKSVASVDNKLGAESLHPPRWYNRPRLWGLRPASLVSGGP